MEKVLIAGISGGQGRLLARHLHDRYRVCGVDRHAWEGRPKGISVYRVDLRKRELSEILRKERPRSVVHMGFVRHFRGDEAERHDRNIRGTQHLLDCCVEAGVERLIVVSSSYVYGAFADNPFYLDEGRPLSASRSYPEIRDLVEVDAMASTFLWREPTVKSAVLRPVGTIGATAHSMIREYLSQRVVPVPLGFDPMMQFIHEDDLTRAIATALEKEVRGVMNVVGPGAIPISVAIRAAGARSLPIPEMLMRPLFRRLFRAGLLPWPEGVIDYMKYPVTVAGERFAEATGFRAECPITELFAPLARRRR